MPTEGRVDTCDAVDSVTYPPFDGLPGAFDWISSSRACQVVCVNRLLVLWLGRGSSALDGVPVLAAVKLGRHVRLGGMLTAAARRRCWPGWRNPAVRASLVWSQGHFQPAGEGQAERTIGGVPALHRGAFDQLAGRAALVLGPAGLSGAFPRAFIFDVTDR